MTVKTCYRQNGVEDLPILNICEGTYCKMTNEELREKLFLGDAMINIGFVDEHDLHSETQFDIYGTHSLKEILDELTELFRDFCKENGYSTRKVLYLQYAGKIPKEDDFPEKYRRDIIQKQNIGE